MKPKWFYEGYVVYQDKERVFHKEVVCVPVEDWPGLYAEWLHSGCKILAMNVRRERWLE